MSFHRGPNSDWADTRGAWEDQCLKRLKRVLLVGPITNYNAGERSWASPPLGVHRIAAFLNSRGYSAEVWDCNIHENLEKKLAEGWDIIGFSPLQNTLHNDVRAMWKAKELCPNAMLVSGGIESTLNYQDIFDNSPVRIVILAEGESQMLKLAGGAVPELLDGVIVKRDAVPLTDDELWNYWSSVDFTKIGYDKYWAQMREKHKDDYEAEGGDTIRLITSTHCNRGCAFCSVTQWHKFACGRITKPAMLSAEQVWNLTTKAHEQLPTLRSIYFCEDDFVQDRQRVVDYFHLIREHGPKLRFQIQTHTSHIIKDDGKVDVELLDHLACGGVEHISMGIENCCPHCLEAFHKSQKLNMVPEIIKECLARKIRPYVLIIMFPASSTRACLELNCRTLTGWLEMGATVSVEPNLMAFKGAPLYTSAHEQIYRVKDVDGKHRIRYPYRILPDDIEARKIQERFNALWPEYLKSKHIEHTWKGETGRIMVELLGEVLKE